MEEREITLALRDHLSKRGWQILSVHFPGAQGGLSVSTYGKTRGWVPDLIALKDNILMTVESKPDYSHDDVNKLDAIYDDTKFIHKLKQKLSLEKEIDCQKAIAFHADSFEQADAPVGYVVFIAKSKDVIVTFFGDKVTNSIKIIL